MRKFIKKLLRPDKYYFITNNWRALFCDCYISRNELYKAVKDNTKHFDGKVLDVGCGSKPYESLFTKVREYIGLDYETPDVEYHKNADFYYDGNTFPFVDQTFEHCVSFQCFEHTPNPERIFKECSRVTKNGGYLFISVPLTFNEHFQPYDYYRFTQYSLKKLCEDAGYKIIEIKALESTIQTLWGLFVYYLSIKTRIGFLRNIIVFSLNLIFPLIKILMPKDYTLTTDYMVLARKETQNP